MPKGIYNRETANFKKRKANDSELRNGFKFPRLTKENMTITNPSFIEKIMAAVSLNPHYWDDVIKIEHKEPMGFKEFNKRKKELNEE
jgi:hypothetical protein